MALQAMPCMHSSGPRPGMLGPTAERNMPMVACDWTARLCWLLHVHSSDAASLSLPGTCLTNPADWAATASWGILQPLSAAAGDAGEGLEGTGRACPAPPEAQSIADTALGQRDRGMSFFRSMPTEFRNFQPGASQCLIKHKVSVIQLAVRGWSRSSENLGCKASLLQPQTPDAVSPSAFAIVILAALCPRFSRRKATLPQAAVDLPKEC